MASLRDINTFIADIEARDPEGRSITQEDFADVLQSLAKVGGVMSYDGGVGTVPIGAGWNRVDIFDNSFDTQGVLSGIADGGDPGGYYVVRDVGAGDYTCSAMLRFTADSPGLYEMRISNSSAFSTFSDGVTVVGGEEVVLTITGAMLLGAVADDHLQVEMRGPNPAVATPAFAQFGVQR
jgi:hypothetical protein